MSDDRAGGAPPNTTHSAVESTRLTIPNQTQEAYACPTPKYISASMPRVNPFTNAMPDAFIP